MATTDWNLASEFGEEYPHTFTALQGFVMGMADFANSRGKRSLFGRDKGLAAYKKFEDKLRDTILAMVIDGIIKRNAEPSEVREKLIEAIELFSATFPNWQDAYAFAHEFLVVDAPIAEDRIKSIMR